MATLATLAQLVAMPSVEALHQRLSTMVQRAVDEAIHVQQIPSPTFNESQRADYVFSRFEGLLDREIDSVYNVYARLPGTNPALPAVLVSAHTDTVFDASTNLDIKRDNGRIYGPGLGDNSMGVAALLILSDLLRDQHFPADIWFVANSREEGMGDLGGIRAVYDKLGSRLGCAIVVEGMAYGRVYHSGIAVRRLKISCQTPGGHSWLHFGRPSAIHTLMRIGAAITTLKPSESPRSTFNIGVIEGGQSVNSIASSASLLLDLRSEEREAVARMESQVRQMIEREREPEMDITVEVVGDRPSGAIPVTHPLVELSRDVLQMLGTQAVFETGSTDANVPLAAGLPTITIGITNGGNAHRLDEFIETESIREGLWQLALLTIASANGLAASNTIPLR